MLTLMLFSASLSSAETITVQGTVSTWEGNPAAHAEVYLLAGVFYRGGVKVLNSTTAGAQGEFSFNNVIIPGAGAIPEAAGRFLKVVCALEGYAISWATPDLKTPAPLKITLARQGTLSGKVTDSAGKPLQGATVRIANLSVGSDNLHLPGELAQRWAQKTDSQGQYTIRAANADQAPMVAVEAPGYNKAFSRLWIEGWETMPTFSLDRESHVTGAVQSTRPRADTHRLQVIARFADISKRAWGGWQERAQVDAAGKFILHDVPPGTIHLSFVYDPTWQWQPAGDHDIVMVEGESQNVVLQAGPDQGTRVTGKVVDAATGAPVAGASINGSGSPVGDWASLGRTGTDGRYSFYSRPGDLKISVYPEQPRYLIPEFIQVKHGIGVGTVPLTVPAFRLKAGIPLHVQVVDEEAKPVEGATVVNRTNGNDWPNIERTNHQGLTELYVAEPDRRVTLAARSDSEFTGAVPYNTGPQEATVRLVLKKGSGVQVRGVVVDKAGHAISGAHVMIAMYFFDAMRSTILLRTDNAGMFQSDLLPPDYFYRVSVTKPGYQQASVPKWQAAPGQIHDVGSIALPTM